MKQKMNRAFLAAGMCLLITSSARGQAGDDDRTDKYRLDNVSVPSPSAAGIARFIDAPVNFSTGAPDISIPLYTINTGKLTWPITLSYNPSGVKVNDNSGNIGLMWNINAEGTIIQNVLGEKDNGTYQSQGGLTWDNAALLPNNAANWTLMTNLSNGGLDGSPDIYMYNFGNQSGKFIYADEVRLLPRKNIVVSSYNDAGSQQCWKIVDENGIRYYFTAKETTKTRSSGANPSYNSWMLTKVVDAWSVDSLVFEYEDTYTESAVGKNYEINNWKDTADHSWAIDMDPNDAPIPGALTQYIQQSTGKQLKRILFNNGSVEYDIAWNDREDLNPSGSGGATAAIQVPRIRNLLVKDKNGNIIKTVHFEHDYFVAPSATSVNDKRLRLSSVTFTDLPTQLSGSDKQKYSFEYSTINLPSKQSNAVDHWGYFNGAYANQTLIPTIHTLGMDYYGANRNTNSSYVTAGMLEKVIYPTGGHTKYTWAAHQRTWSGPTQYYIATSDSVLFRSFSIEGMGGTLQYLNSESVTIPDNDTFNIVEATLKVSAGFPDSTAAAWITHAASSVLLYEVNSNGSQILKKKLTVTASTSHVLTFDVNLYRGRTYFIKVQSQGGFEYSVAGSLKMEWPYLAQLPSGGMEFIGGCRVAKIESFDPMSNKTLTKKYQYGNTRVLKRPLYYRKIYRYVDPQEGTSEVVGVPSCTHEEATGLFMSSNSLYSIGGGNHVTYDEVTELIGENGEGGRTKYSYQNFGQNIGEVDASWRRGILTSVNIYNAAGTLLHETFYRNTNTMAAHFAGHTTSLTGMHPCATAATASGEVFPTHFFQQIYDFPIDWIHTDSVFTHDYTTGMHGVQAKEYNNAQHMQVTSATSLLSDGSRVSSFTKYPTDFTLTGTLNSNEAEAIKLLQDKHIHTIPLEQYSQKWLPGASTSLTIGASCLEFRTAGQYDDIALVNHGYSLEQTQGLADFQPMSIAGNVVHKDSRYTENGTGREYDKRTNLVTVNTTGGRSNGYIWGYNQTFPIASVTNNGLNKFMGFTSFEKNANGNWMYNEAATTQSEALTGKRCLDLNSGTAGIDFTNSSGLVYGYVTPGAAGKYIVSYWRKSGSVTVNGTSPTAIGMTANEWTYCEHLLIDPVSVAVNGNTRIDELRFYPVEARVKSYTYDPLVGMTSADNEASSIILYEYDAMGRLSVERDIFGKIIKKHTYQYQVTE